MSAKIIYTLTHEAPALATYSLLPIVQTFSKAAGITVETRDISIVGRNTQGVRLIRLAEGERLTGVERIESLGYEGQGDEGPDDEPQPDAGESSGENPAGPAVT
jgi:hypothetical protein